MNIFVIMVGGFLGAISRFFLAELFTVTDGFPFGTLAVNLVGCFFLGWFLSFVSMQKKVKPEFVLFIGTGFIGSFTTFSTFSLETVVLLEAARYYSALSYVIVSVFVGIYLAYLGTKLAVFSPFPKSNGEI